MGEFESAIQMATRGYAIGESIGDARIQSYALWNQGWYQAASGAAAAGIAACQQSLQQSPDPFNTTAATGWLGYAYLEARQPALAVPYLEQSLASWTQYEYGPLIGLFTGWLADAVRSLGDLERAAQLAQRALNLSGRLEFWWAAGWAERVLGHIARDHGDPYAARNRLGSALETYQSNFTRELHQLQSAFETASTGDGALILLVGEPGIGKTALSDQLCRFVSTVGGRSIVGHCDEEGSFRPPYQPFVEVFGSYLHDLDTAALQAELGSSAADLARMVPTLRERLRVSPQPPSDPKRTAGGCSRPQRTCSITPPPGSRSLWCSRTCTTPTGARSTSCCTSHEICRAHEF
jgi:tetratricopeptide (TPR) repeat protein